MPHMAGKTVSSQLSAPVLHRLQHPFNGKCPSVLTNLVLYPKALRSHSCPYPARCFFLLCASMASTSSAMRGADASDTGSGLARRWP